MPLTPRVVAVAMTAPSVVDVRAKMSKTVDVCVTTNSKVVNDSMTVLIVIVESTGSVAMGSDGVAMAQTNKAKA